ncbi:DNA replication/repair protein RecF [Patescibacteria group bacterium]|nr:DNA replication/repair protein RecF [Patescibacteria group bacterium]
MKLSTLQLENFRNYRDFSFNFTLDPKITIFHGQNGLGKTNLLEAIYMLSLGKSFRSSHNEDLTKWDLDYFRIKAQALTGEEKSELEVFYSSYPNKKKNFKKNGVNLKNSEYIGNFLTVLFHPEDLNILYLSPSLRRRYLNILLSQVDREYLHALIKYTRTLKQRNALLHQIKKAKFANQPTASLLQDLDAWDTELVEFGSTLIEKRLSLVESINEQLTKIYQRISGEKDEITADYETKALTKEDFYMRLKNRRDIDLIQSTTTIGPHRDDLIFFINEKPLTTSASRGEIRTVLLALKLLEIEFIKQKTGLNPILLLDDVFSELDHERQDHLLDTIKDCQSIITTTEIDNLHDLKGKSNTINLAEQE